MATDNKTNSQTIDYPVDYTQFIRKLKTIEYFLVGFQLFAYGFIAGIFVNLFIGLSGLPYSEFSANLFGFYAICFAIPIVLLSLLFNRNRFFISHINRRTSSGYVYFSYYWRIAIPSFTAVLMLYYFFYAFTRDIRFFTMPFAILYIMLSIFLVFDNPLTEDGQTYILVDSAIDNIGNFRKVMFFWKGIAKKIEQELRIGEYNVSRYDLIFYFTQKLLETDNDLTNDLISFRNWLLGNQRSCYEALTHILPKNKIKRQTGFLESNKLSNRLKRNWKIALEVSSFAASIATIITLVRVFIS